MFQFENYVIKTVSHM